MNVISPEELVKALKYYGVVVQSEENSNRYKLVYNARVKKFVGEKCIVLETFK